MTRHAASKMSGIACLFFALLGCAGAHVSSPVYQSLAEALKGTANGTDTATKRRRLEKMVKNYPTSPVPLYILGQSYEHEGKYEEAARCYEEAIERKASCALCRESLGKLLIQTGRVREGESQLRESKKCAVGGES